MAGSSIGKHHRLDQRVGCEAVGAMQTSTGTLTVGIQPSDAGTSVQIHNNTTAKVMGSRCYGNHLTSDVDTIRKTFFIDAGKMLFCFCCILVCDIEKNMFITPLLHLTVNGTGHDVAWCERAATVVFMHELLSINCLQDTTIATHRLGDQKGGTCTWMIECCGMKLHKLHTLDLSLGTGYHRNSITCSNQGIGSGLVYRSDAAGSHHGNACKERINLVGLLIQNIGTIALYARRMACYYLSQVMLRKYLNGKMMVVNINIRMFADCVDQTHLYLRPSTVFMVQDAILGMPSLTVQVEIASLITVEVHPPTDQLPDLCGSLPHYFLYHPAVT